MGSAVRAEVVTCHADTDDQSAVGSLPLTGTASCRETTCNRDLARAWKAARKLILVLEAESG